MRVVILTNRQGNQVALANKISKNAEVAGIVFSKNIPARGPALAKRAKLVLNRVAARTIGRTFVQTWYQLQAKYDSIYPQLPVGNIVDVDNINDDSTAEAIEKLKPELVVVSGTNIVGKRVIQAAQSLGGIINLHTGISPYVRGGPNCTNWCLAKRWFHLIGNTVMWLDAGIDTGNIIATEQTELDGNETLLGLHWKVMEHAHGVYTRAIFAIGRGKLVPSIPQKDIAAGAYFGSVDWNAIQMRRAMENYQRSYKAFFADPESRRMDSAILKLYPVTDV